MSIVQVIKNTCKEKDIKSNTPLPPPKKKIDEIWRQGGI